MTAWVILVVQPLLTTGVNKWKPYPAINTHEADMTSGMSLIQPSQLIHCAIVLIAYPPVSSNVVLLENPLQMQVFMLKSSVNARLSITMFHWKNRGFYHPNDK